MNSTAIADAVTEQSVWQIVEQVWESLLSDPAVRAHHDGPASGDVDSMTAVVRLSGAWTGAVQLTCPADAAASMARVMLALDEGDDVTPIDVEDALGEVVNVIGGNVKALVQGSSSLSLPSVQAGAADVGGDVVRRVGVVWDGARVDVVVREAEAACV